MNTDNPQDFSAVFPGAGSITASTLSASAGDLVNINMTPLTPGRAIPWQKIEKSVKEYTGGSVSYYKVVVDTPTSGGQPYSAECNDIIEALHMNYAEGNAFKAIWRSCAARNLSLSKDGYKDGLYDAEKVVFFGKRMVEQAKNV